MSNISAVSGTEDNVLNAMAFGYYPVGEWYLHDGRNLPDVSPWCRFLESHHQHRL